MRNARNLAVGLWIAWAIVVWNVVFDRVIVLAGRQYIAAALLAVREGKYARMDDWMGSAVTRGAWLASAASLAILLVGFFAIRYATASARLAEAKEVL